MTFANSRSAASFGSPNVPFNEKPGMTNDLMTLTLSRPSVFMGPNAAHSHNDEMREVCKDMKKYRSEDFSCSYKLYLHWVVFSLILQFVVPVLP